jgi:DNA-binding beta-propeller fold protein YncE
MPSDQIRKLLGRAARLAAALAGYEQAAQIARYSPDGRYLVVTSHNEATGSVLSSDLETQHSFPLGRGPMDIAFHPDGRTGLVGNQGDGTISVLDLAQGIAHRTIPAGDGVESLAFF